MAEQPPPPCPETEPEKTQLAEKKDSLQLPFQTHKATSQQTTLLSTRHLRPLRIRRSSGLKDSHRPNSPPTPTPPSNTHPQDRLRLQTL